MSTKKLFQKRHRKAKLKGFKAGDIIVFHLRYGHYHDKTYGVLVKGLKAGQPATVKIYTEESQKIIKVSPTYLKHTSKKEQVEFTMLRLTGKGSTIRYVTF